MAQAHPRKYIDILIGAVRSGEPHNELKDIIALTFVLRYGVRFKALEVPENPVLRFRGKEHYEQVLKQRDNVNACHVILPPTRPVDAANAGVIRRVSALRYSAERGRDSATRLQPLKLDQTPRLLSLVLVPVLAHSAQVADYGERRLDI